MRKELKPQIYPTNYLRSFVVKFLNVSDRLPFLRRLLVRDNSNLYSETPVTVVIPLHPKDLWIVGRSITQIRKFLRHPIHEVVIVSPRDKAIQDWVSSENVRWVCEDDVATWSKDDVRQQLPEHALNRDRWIFQQLLKFSMDSFVETEAYLVLDADTLLLKPKVFRIEDELWVDYSHERNLLYLKSYKNLLGEKPHSFVSYVTHHMWMERLILRELKSEIEKNTGKDWQTAIVELAAANLWTEKQKKIRPFNYFSEYETYGNFVRNRYPKVQSHYFRNFSPHDYEPETNAIDYSLEKLPDFYQWASFHSYNRKEGS